MTVELSYKYCELDKCESFGLVFKDTAHWEIYIRWVYFFLGRELINVDVSIYPYNFESKVLKTYKNCNDARRQAKLLANRIKKKLNN